MPPGFLCWPKPFQIKARVGLANVFFKEIPLSMTLPLFMEHLLYTTMVAGDTGKDKAESLCLLVPGSLIKVNICASTGKITFKLREFKFSFVKSK